MMQINQILAGMVTTIFKPPIPCGFGDCLRIGLDLSKATITTTQNGIVSILGARLAASTAEVGVVGASTPRRTLDFVFLDSTIPVGPYVDTPLGAGQHIEPSVHGTGSDHCVQHRRA